MLPSQRFLDRVASGAQAGGEIKPVDGRPSRNGLQPGTILVREWNGVLQRVIVLDRHFAWNGTTYRGTKVDPPGGLTAVAESSIGHEAMDAEIAHLRDLDVAGLQARWRTVFRRAAADHLPRNLLFRVLAYRLQAERFGHLDKDTQRSLTEVAVAMTGTRWSGPRFFGLRDRPKRSA
jgi:Protein of unknown function (DUF2924)